MRLALLAAFCLFPLAAHAQSHSYIGPMGDCTQMGMDSGAWQCDLNWNAGAAPGQTSTVQIGSDDVRGVFSSSIVQGLVLNGTTLRTIGSLQINDTFEWTAGFLQTGGTISVVGNGFLQGPLQKNLQGTDLRVDAIGIVEWTGGVFSLDGQAAIDNHGTFDAQSDRFLSGGQFINRITGRLTRNADPNGTTTIFNLLNEGGLVYSQSGTLLLDLATYQNGEYDADAGATLNLAGMAGPTTMSGTLSGDPAGQVVFENGSARLTIAGPTTLAFSGTGLEWRGSFFDPGGETLTNTGLLVFNGNHDFDNGTIRNEGTIRWEAGDNLMSMFTFENAGLYDLQGDSFALTGSNTVAFINEDGGTLRRSTSAGNAIVSIPITSLSGSTVDLVEGTLVLSSNSSLDLQPGSLLKGTGTFDATASNGVTFGGTVAPGTSTGILTYLGDVAHPYAPTATGVLEIEIGGTTPGSGHDQLRTTGPAQLGGTLRVTLLGGFRPQTGDRFQIVDAPAGATGQFDAVELPAGVSADVVASATGVEIVVTQVVASEPGQNPSALTLHPASPNPVSGRAQIRFDLPQPSHVRLAVHDALGREVALLLDAERAAGSHEVGFDPAGLPSGLYVVQMTSGAVQQSRTFTVAR